MRIVAVRSIESRSSGDGGGGGCGCGKDGGAGGDVVCSESFSTYLLRLSLVKIVRLEFDTVKSGSTCNSKTIVLLLEMKKGKRSVKVRGYCEREAAGSLLIRTLRATQNSLTNTRPTNH